MSLFSDIGDDVDDLLSDEDFNTADIRIRRKTGTTPGVNVYDDPIEVWTTLKLSGVVFTRKTRKSDFEGGSLVIQRIDEITASPKTSIIEEDSVPVSPRPFYLTKILSTDEFVIDGVIRQVTQIVRIPAAGPDVSVWQVQVLR